MNLLKKLKNIFFVQYRIFKYKILSDCATIEGTPKLFHPLLIVGKGKVVFGFNVQNGVVNSPYFYSNYSYLEARNENSLIQIGNNVTINNNFSAVAFDSICIKDNVIVGVNCSIIDSDGHHLNPDSRMDFHAVQTQKVLIEENVFIGDNVTILKGVTVGKNSIIGNGSMVTKNVPENVIVAGNPARLIKSLL